MSSKGEEVTELEREIFGGSSDESGQEEDMTSSQNYAEKSDKDDEKEEAFAEEGQKLMEEDERPKRSSASSKKASSRKTHQADEEEATNKIMEARKDFDEALDKIKTTGRRGNKIFDIGEPVDLDEIALNFVRKMVRAVDTDYNAISNGKAALERQKILDQVIDMLTKKHFHEVLLDNGILEAVRRWLEPMPDRSLPTPNIRKSLLECLKTMPIETVHLRESGVGKIINYFSQRPNEIAEIRRLSNDLITAWSRPILQRSSTYAQAEAQVREGSIRLQSESFKKAQRRFPAAVESVQQKKIVQGLAKKKAKSLRF